MKSSAVILIAGLAVFATSAHAFENEPAGFRGIDWGAPVDSVIQELRVVDDSEDSKFYIRPTDKLAIGGAVIESISYIFYKGKFHSVQIKANGRGNDAAFRDAMFATFGRGTHPNQFIERWFWRGTTAFILLTCDNVPPTCTAQIASVQMLQAQRTDRAAKAAAGKKDF